ncbi:hypothetical protein Tco_0143732 [Tanacetum coccineum]
MLANYGVANGYQLWYAHNDWKCILVQCEKDVEGCRCAGAYSKKKVQKKMFDDVAGLSDKCKSEIPKSKPGPKPKSKHGPKLMSKNGKTIKNKTLTFRKLILTRSMKDGEDTSTCLHPGHKCSRNYRLGSLVTYKWIAHQYAKEIIDDPFISYKLMKSAIRQKFMTDVSLSQCKRAKQRTLYDHEGGLVEHYGRLFDYRPVILDINPGSTCRLDVKETHNRNA